MIKKKNMNTNMVEFENLLDRHTKIHVPKGYQVVNAKKRTEKTEKAKKSEL